MYYAWLKLLGCFTCKYFFNFIDVKVPNSYMNSVVDELKDYLVIARSIFENFIDGVSITTPNINNPRILYVNQAMSQLTGYECDELVGSSPQQLQGDKTCRKVTARLKNLLSKGESFYGSTINYRKCGSEYQVEWKVFPVYGSEGKLLCYISVQKNVTLVREILSLAASTSPEFKAKLKSIIATRFKPDTDKQQEKRLNSIINDTTFFSKSSDPFEDIFSFGDVEITEPSSEQQYVPLTSEAYIEREQILEDDILHLMSVLNDCAYAIEVSIHTPENQTAIIAFRSSFQELANILFLMNEFVELSIAISGLAHNLNHVTDWSGKSIVYPLLLDLTIELDNWATDVFCKKSSNDIHEFDASLIASVKQIQMFLA